uniref:Uncharacterized protein n=1 Tax=Cajanus cajan TaxID=3821 RepID=A0A151RQ92_CAJCA|nr:hypothetical protein KK1_033776 [Cajanus cajan]
MAVVGRRFGDEESTLLDEFERLSFEAHAAQLNRVMLGRSLSEPKLQKSHSRLISVAPIPLVTHVMQGQPRHHHGRVGGSGFHRVLNKLLKPILGIKRGRRKQHVSDNKDVLSCKAFSRSLRF